MVSEPEALKRFMKCLSWLGRYLLAGASNFQKLIGSFRAGRFRTLPAGGHIGVGVIDHRVVAHSEGNCEVTFIAILGCRQFTGALGKNCGALTDKASVINNFMIQRPLQRDESPLCHGLDVGTIGRCVLREPFYVMD